MEWRQFGEVASVLATFTLEFGSGMGGGVDLLKHTDGDLGIDLGGVEAGMAKELLDKADICAIFQHQGGGGVAEEMTGTTLADVGCVHIFADKLAHAVSGKGLTVGGQEEVTVIRLSCQCWPHFIKVFGYPGQGPFTDWGHAVFFTFALTDNDGSPVGIDVVKFEVDYLHTPHTCGVQGLQDGPVTDAELLVDVRAVDDLLRLPFGEHMLGQAVFQLGKVKVGCRIVKNVVVLGQPLEEGPHRGKVGVLVAKAQGLAVLFAVVVKIPLVTLHDRAGDLGGSGQTPLIGPDDKVVDIEPPVLHGPFRVVLDQHPFQIGISELFKALRIGGIADNSARRFLTFSGHRLSPPWQLKKK